MTTTAPTGEEANRAPDAQAPRPSGEPGLKRCGICLQLFPILVDGEMCTRCDAKMFPKVTR